MYYMRQNILIIELIPDFESEAKSLGYKDADDINVDAVFFAQGSHMQQLEVTPGEEFRIPWEYEGRIDNTEGHYSAMAINKLKEGIRDEDGFIILYPGLYLFN